MVFQMYNKEIMEKVIIKAEELCNDEVPVVAAIAIGNDIITVCGNEVEASGRPWNHAEFLAIQRSLEILTTRYLDDASLYVTLEPCAFCAAALEKVRIKNIFFGAYDPKCGAIFHNVNLFQHSLVKPNIIGGIQEGRCSKILSNFFKDLRRQK